MLLAIDIGNTNIVFALYDGEDQKGIWRVETKADCSKLFLDLKAFDVQDAVACSVVPNVNEKITNLALEHLGVTPVFITSDNIDIQIETDVPAQMGADRFVGASAVKAIYQTPAIIIDFGTATTFDVLDGKGAHQGGIIAPGVNLSLQALENAAAQLPNIKIEKPSQVIGKNTKEAMQSGIYWGYISLIEGNVKRISDEMQSNKPPFIVATGGLAPLFEKGTDIFDVMDQDLIMKGLVHMHKVLKNDRRKTLER